MKKTGTERKKGRYQIKKERGLVPHVYDRDSRSHMEGAWKNWPHTRDENRKIAATQAFEDRNEKVDRDFLQRARESTLTVGVSDGTQSSSSARGTD